jgi:hypothetical protein
MRDRVRTPSPAWLLVPAGLLFAAWSFVVPVFEAPDEPAHWQYARYLHDHWSLPRYEAGFEEANSPPLYYLAIAPLAVEAGSPSMVIATDDRQQPISLAPPRTFLNAQEDVGRYWPIRFGRLVSVLMSVGTVWVTYLAGRAATGQAGTGLVAALLVALLPQFAFRGAQVSNDALVTLFSGATTLGIARLLASGFTWPRALWTSAAFAGAYLSKISAIALGPAVALALVAAAPAAGWRARAVRLWSLGLAVALVLPWSLRNQLLYGDPFASGAMASAVAHIITPRSLFSSYFLSHFPIILFCSFVGAFGWLSLLLPKWVYAVYAGGGLAAAAGLLRATWRRSLPPALAAALVLIALGTLAVVVRINLQFTQPQGRYLFPALTALGVLAAVGLQGLPRPLSRLAHPLVVALVLGSINLGILAFVVWPAYYPAPLRTLESGERLLAPVALSGLARRADGSFIETGPAAWWISPADVEASRFRTIVLDLRGEAPRASQRGCVLFATTTATLADSTPFCFDWTADGRSRRVAIDASAHPNWAGRITHVRVDPFTASGDGPRAVAARVTLNR